MMSKQRADEEGMGPLERGRGRYQQKDYQNALAAFNEVSDGHAANRKSCPDSPFGKESFPKILSAAKALFFQPESLIPFDEILLQTVS